MKLELVGHLAFLIMAFSFLVKDMLLLRSFSILASICAISFNYLFPVEPMWVTIYWHCSFITLNFYHIGLIIYEKFYLILKGKERDLYESLKCDISPLEFKKMLKLGDWKNSDLNEILIKEGEFVKNLILIHVGKVSISVNNNFIVELGPGHFIGEMSFLSNKKASATVITPNNVEYFVWNQNELRKHLVRNPGLLLSFQSLISKQVIESLTNNNANKKAA